MSNPSSQDTEFRRFLLGTASDDESEAFSLDLLNSAREESGDVRLLQALAEEDELFDEYVRGELDDDAIRRFESLILSRPEGRRRLAFARVLMKRAEAARRDATEITPTLAAGHTESEVRRGDDTDEPWWRRLLRSFEAPAARPAWALCFLLLIAAAAQTYRLAQLSERTTPETPIADRAQPASPDADAESARVARLSAEVDELRRRLDESTGQVESLQSELDSAKAAARPVAPKVVSLLLAATVRGASADSIPPLNLPADADTVELQVDLSGSTPAGAVRARLLDADDFQVWGASSAATEGQPGAPGLRLQVPAEVWSAGVYRLRLETMGTDGSWSHLAQYELRIAGR